MMPLLLSILPIVLLIRLMMKKNSIPSYIALSITATLIYAIRLFYSGDDAMLPNTTAASGLASTPTPITVIFDVIMFNRMVETTGCIGVIRKWLATISPNPVAQLMTIGWAFAFMTEGASGSGTPAATVAPTLMSLGFDPLKVTTLTLVMNSMPTSFGAVGTPTWPGFTPLNLSAEDIMAIGRQTGIMHFVAGFIIPVIGPSFIVPWAEIHRNLGFAGISVFSCIIPYVILAMVNGEFPSLVMGVVGLLASVFVVNHDWGLSKDHAKDPNVEKVPFAQVAKALTPLGMLIGMLVVTRTEQLGAKGLSTGKIEWSGFQLPFDLSRTSVSDSLTATFGNIFGQGVSESYQMLYVPARIPLVLAVRICIALYKTKFKDAWEFHAVTPHQIKKPLLALTSVLIMMKLMMVGGDNSMVKIIGKELAAMAGEHQTYFSPYLGAIGVFFSGLNTVSNPTLGPTQQQIALDTDLFVIPTLVLQLVGGTTGNTVCTNNIIAVRTVLDVHNAEGVIIKKTAIPMVIYGVIAAAVALVLFL